MRTAPATLPILAAASAGVFLLAHWQRWIFPFIPNYYFQHALIYLCLPAMAWTWLAGRWHIADGWRTARPFLPWLAALFVLQALACWQSATLFAAPGQSVAKAVAVSLARLAVQLPFPLLFMELCRLMAEDGEARRAGLAGAVVSCLALFAICLLQLAYLYTLPGTEGLAGAANQALRTVLLPIATFLEARWPDAYYAFYAGGSYTLTVQRVNGVFEEASALAVVLAAFHIPLGFGLLALGRAVRRRRVAWLGIAIICVGSLLLALCRSSTALLLLPVVLAAGIFAAPRQWRLRACAAIAVLIVVFGLLAVRDSKLAFFVKRFENPDVRQLPRMLIPLELAGIAAAHPLLGVGRGWYGPYLTGSATYRQAAERNEELQAWERGGTIPPLSALLGQAAQYGLIVIGAAILMLVRMRLRLRSLARAAPDSALFAFCDGACAAWLPLFLAASLGSLDLRNPLVSLPFCLLYVVSRMSAQADRTTA